MTRVVPSQPSPIIRSYEMFSRALPSNPTSAVYSPSESGVQTPDQRKVTKNLKMIKPKLVRPSYSKMIEEAIFEKSEKRKGASLKTIKKYLQQKYSVDIKKSAWRIRKCIRDSVGNGGNLRQMTGNGANGSFALENKLRRRLQIQKEKDLIFKPIKSVPSKAAKIREHKLSLVDASVTRMRVK